MPLHMISGQSVDDAVSLSVGKTKLICSSVPQHPGIYSARIKVNGEHCWNFLLCEQVLLVSLVIKHVTGDNYFVFQLHSTWVLYILGAIIHEYESMDSAPAHGIQLNATAHGSYPNFI